MLDFNFDKLFNIERVFDFANKSSRAPKPVPVVRRINALLDSHGLQPSQLLRIVPSEWNWTLANVADDNRLLSSINGDVLIWFATTFDVNLAWLEGASDQVHEFISGYKNLPRFFREISDLGWTDPGLCMTILAEDYSTKYPFLHRYAIVLSLPAINLESTDETVYKHRLFDHVWNYCHPPCVRDTKAVARWFTKRQGSIRPVPIVPVNKCNFEAVTEGEHLLPTVWTNHIGGFDRFEDRVLYDSESVCAKETHNLNGIVAYLDSVLAGTPEAVDKFHQRVF